MGKGCYLILSLFFLRTVFQECVTLREKLDLSIKSSTTRRTQKNFHFLAGSKRKNLRAASKKCITHRDSTIFFSQEKQGSCPLMNNDTKRNSLCICKHVLRKIRRRKKTVCSRCNGPPAKEEFSSDSISSRRQDICGHILLSIMACANRYQLLRKRHNLTHHQDTLLEMEFLGRKEKQCRNWSVAPYRKEFIRPWSVNE